jgi:hypothetical protein
MDPSAASVVQNTARFSVETEPAYYSPYKHVTIIPYYTNTVSAVVRAPAAVVPDVSYARIPSASAFASALNPHLYSPLPPYGAYAMRHLIAQNWEPIQQVLELSREQ